MEMMQKMIVRRRADLDLNASAAVAGLFNAPLEMVEHPRRFPKEAVQLQNQLSKGSNPWRRIGAQRSMGTTTFPVVIVRDTDQKVHACDLAIPLPQLLY